MSARFSVVVTCYNQGAMIVAMLPRLLMDLRHEDEVIVSDDGSSDDSVARIREIAAHDSRVRVITSEPTGSVSRNRNRGAALASGDWVSFLDGDDEYCAGRRDVFGRGIEACVGADILFSDYSLWSGDQSETLLVSALGSRELSSSIAKVSTEQPSGWMSVPSEELSLICMDRGSPLIVVNSIFRVEWLRKTGVAFDSRFSVAEDTDFIVRAIQGAQVYFRDVSTAKYRVSNTGLDSRRDLTAVYARVTQRATYLQLSSAVPGSRGEVFAWRAIARHELEVSYILRKNGHARSALRFALRSIVASPRPNALVEALKALVTLVTGFPRS